MKVRNSRDVIELAGLTKLSPPKNSDISRNLRRENFKKFPLQKVRGIYTTNRSLGISWHLLFAVKDENENAKYNMKVVGVT